MGNRFGKICGCCVVSDRRRGDVLAIGGSGEGHDEGLGHSFCYIRPDLARLSSSKVHNSEETTTFRSISGAALGANTSTPLSTDLCSYAAATAAFASAAFESSDSFQSIPLQPVPRFGGGGGGGGGGGVFSGPIGVPPFSGPIERGFMSGPIERGFLSGPLDKAIFSGPLDKFQRSFSHGGMFAGRHRKASLIKALRRAITNAVARSSIVAPLKLGVVGFSKEKKPCSGNNDGVAENFSGDAGGGGGSELVTTDEDFSFESQNLQWAQGKAGEDRVHVVISEEHGWLFVGIYDGFNGPDAPDYLLSNLYTAVQMELKGLLWEQPPSVAGAQQNGCSSSVVESNIYSSDQNWTTGGYGENDEKLNNGVKRRKKRNCRSRFKGVSKKWEESQRRWKAQYGSSKVKEGTVDHGRVVKALARALRKTEEDYLEIADKMLSENPELALMGSCVLVMLMKGEDVYLMNVGDSRGVLAQRVEADLWDLERINEEAPSEFQFRDEDYSFSDNSIQGRPSLSALQLTLDHSTSVEEEVKRIRKEHPDDACAIMNDRVKGSLKVTRAFGAGFLKQRKWNDALLQMFQIDYIGTASYLTCAPSLYHHRLGPRDRFLILSSDGLYQYFTNEEAVAEVEMFIQSYPEGDPAQHLVEEVLFRAAKKAGMDFHELLEIPHGDRRRYHDDVSIIVVSLEGRIWRSCV